MLLKDYIEDAIATVAEKIEGQSELCLDIGVFPNRTVEGKWEIHVDEQSANRVKFTVSIGERESSD